MPLALCSLLFAISCGSSGGSASTVSQTNQPPLAVILVNQTEVTAGSEIVLDGTQSVDPERNAVTYRWYECDEYLSWLQNMGYESNSPYYLDCNGNAQTDLLNIPSVPGLQSDLGEYAEGPTQSVILPDEGEYTFVLVVNDGELDSSPQEVVITVSPAPSTSRPIAMAYADPTGGISGAKIILNGSKSKATTSGRTISEYQWYENAANPQLNLIKKVALLPYASGVTQAVWPVTPGTYRFTLIVIDSGGTYSSPNNNDEVQVVISAQNHAPTALAGSNRVVKRGDLVTLNGSGSSDPDNNTLNYSWTLSPPTSSLNASLSNPTTQQPSFTPDVSGDYLATLVVNDGLLASQQASVKIHCNFPPYPNPGTNQTVSIGELVTLDGSSSFDADLDLITYSWIMSAPAGSFAALNSLIVARPTFVPDREGNYIFRLALNDGLENSDYPAWVTVTAINRRPIAVAKASPNPASLAAIVQLDGSSCYDPEGYPVKYAWSLRSRPAGSVAPITYPNAVTPTFVADKVGNFLVKLVVNDGFIDSYADWVTVTATNLRPRAVAKANPANISSKTRTSLYGNNSSDPEGFALSYQWQCLPTSPYPIVVTNTVNNPNIGPFNKTGIYSFKLTVTDNGGLTYSDWTTVTVTNLAPLAVARANMDILKIGDTTTLDGSDSFDPDGTIASYLWQKTFGPSVTISTPNPVNGITGTTTFNTAGSYVFKLTVTDNGGLTYSDWVTVAVNNLPPIAAARVIPTNPTINVDQVLLDGTRSSDPEGAVLSYYWKPAWWNPSVVNPSSTTSSSTIAGTFPNAATYTYILKVTDNDGRSDEDIVIVSPQTVAGPVNTRPNAEAKVKGQDQANAGFYESVTLDGRSSNDPDVGNSIVFYSWQQVSGIPVNLEISEWPKAVTFTAPDELGNLVFSLVVSDGKSLSYPDYVTVSVWRSIFTSAYTGDAFIDRPNNNSANQLAGEPAGLFVSQRGNDVPYCGDPVTTPCQTISYAIHDRWPTNVTADVYVGNCGPTGNGACTGTFHENNSATYGAPVKLYDASAKRGVSIFGGFFEDGTGNWWRDMDKYPTAVTITTIAELYQIGVVSCDTIYGTIFINNPTYIDGFKITCNPVGTNHYAILCDSSTVTIRNNAIYGDNAGNGIAGNGTINWAIFISDGAGGAGSPTIVNNYINGGTAGGGAPNETYGIYFYRSGIDSLVAHNLIFAGNPTFGTSYGILAQSTLGIPSTPHIINNIINGGSAGNKALEQYGVYENGTYADSKLYNNDILITGKAPTKCLYYDADGVVCRSTIDSVNSMINAGYNLSVNPKFENMDWGDAPGKHLTKESQCIDAGTDAGVRSDWGGNKRPVDVRLPDGTDVDNNPLDTARNVFDIGPYEYPNAVSQP